jgi:hypothetical protein
MSLKEKVLACAHAFVGEPGSVPDAGRTHAVLCKVHPQGREARATSLSLEVEINLHSD